MIFYFHSFYSQVYKVVVDWTDGKNIIIYRKYSFFFDFVVSTKPLGIEEDLEAVQDFDPL